jgi:hypothetical protein
VADACVWCGAAPGPGPPPAYGLCPGCIARVEDELADAAGRYGRPARPDAETVADEPRPIGLGHPPSARSPAPP